MSDQPQHYRIVRLEAENFKRLSAVDITPQGDIVTLTGENGNGKSSVLDAITAALAGKDHIDDMPIRKGAEKGEITIDLGQLIVKRKFLPSGTTVEVRSKEGARYDKPQKMLDDLLSLIAFDPLAFTRMKSDDQYDTLRKLAPLDVDIDELDEENAADFEARTDINREVKRLQAVTDELREKLNAHEIKPEPVDLQATILEHDNLLGQQLRARELDGNIQRFGEALTDIEAQIKTLQDRLVLGRKALDDAKIAREALTPPTDEQISQIKSKITQAEATNAAAAEYDRQERDMDLHSKDLLARMAKSKALTDAMDARDKQKAEAIAAAQMPIKGLSMENGGVIYNGVPFSQASKAEQIKVSTAIAIAMNPALRIIRIEDASLLDDASLEVIRKMAKMHDFQIWMEMIKSDDPLAILIQDGCVAGAKKAAA